MRESNNIRTSKRAVMNDRPTPETDKARNDFQRLMWSGSSDAFNVKLVPIDHARKLERERDELREALRTMHEAKGRHNTMIAMESLINLLPPT